MAGIYGEIKGLERVEVKGARIADAAVGTYIIMVSQAFECAAPAASNAVGRTLVFVLVCL